jgi:hypothetical protein
MSRCDLGSLASKGIYFKDWKISAEQLNVGFLQLKRKAEASVERGKKIPDTQALYLEYKSKFANGKWCGNFATAKNVPRHMVVQIPIANSAEREVTVSQQHKNKRRGSSVSADAATAVNVTKKVISRSGRGIPPAQGSRPPSARHIAQMAHAEYL